MRNALIVLIGLLLVVPLVAQPRSVQASGVVDAADECVVLDTTGMGTASISVQGTFVGTIAWSSRVNSGPAVGLFGTLVNSQALPVSQTMREGQWIAAITGANAVQACLTSYTSGSATVTVSAIPVFADSRPPCNPVTKLSGRCRP